MYANELPKPNECVLSSSLRFFSSSFSSSWFPQNIFPASLQFIIYFSCAHLLLLLTAVYFYFDSLCCAPTFYSVLVHSFKHNSRTGHCWRIPTSNNYFVFLVSFVCHATWTTLHCYQSDIACIYACRLCHVKKSILFRLMRRRRWLPFNRFKVVE